MAYARNTAISLAQIQVLSKHTKKQRIKGRGMKVQWTTALGIEGGGRDKMKIGIEGRGIDEKGVM